MLSVVFKLRILSSKLLCSAMMDFTNGSLGAETPVAGGSLGDFCNRLAKKSKIAILLIFGRSLTK